MASFVIVVYIFMLAKQVWMPCTVCIMCPTQYWVVNTVMIRSYLKLEWSKCMSVSRVTSLDDKVAGIGLMYVHVSYTTAGIGLMYVHVSYTTAGIGLMYVHVSYTTWLICTPIILRLSGIVYARGTWSIDHHDMGIIFWWQVYPCIYPVWLCYCLLMLLFICK